jgi:endogenous inhibitor of DNA gyrase (YacG/DUF329 family)
MVNIPPHYRDQPSPGPWKWVPFLNWDGGLQAADGTYVIGNDETDNTPDNPHDAALIALAPTMREMLLRIDDQRPSVHCPICGATGFAHAEDCELAALTEKLR